MIVEVSEDVSPLTRPALALFQVRGDREFHHPHRSVAATHFGNERSGR